LHAQTGTYSGGGNGTSEAQAIEIATVADLIELSKTANSADWSLYFKLTSDISFNADAWNNDWDGDGTTNTSSAWAEDSDDEAGFSPIGNSGTKFTGTFDGQGFEISNLYAKKSSGDENIGLFGYALGATIFDVGVVSCDLSGGYCIGGLVGLNEDGSITNSYSSGSLSGIYAVGGLVGENDNSVVKSSYSTCTITGDDTGYIGGLIGYYSNGSIVSHCYSTGSVSGATCNYVGGLIGCATSDCLIEQSYASGSVSGVRYVGGLVGFQDASKLASSYSTGSVSGNQDVGGLIGKLYPNNETGIVINSFSTGNVAGTGTSREIGGLVGFNASGRVEKSYCTGTVSGNTNVGGFFGYYYYGTNTSNYWRQDNGSYNTGLSDIGYHHNLGQANVDIDEIHATTDTDMKKRNTYSDWNFTAGWEIEEDISYPTLQIIVTTPASVPADWSEGNGGSISNIAELRWVAENTTAWDENWVLTADIDATETFAWNTPISGGLQPIGTYANNFVGEFDGNGHVISNLYIYQFGRSYVGLFGKTTNATITDIGIVNCEFETDYSIGGLIGSCAGGNVNNSYTTGKITGYGNIGGLVGYNDNGTISRNYSKVTVNAKGDNVGGFAGCNYLGSITECYASGETSGTGYVGGFVGYNNQATVRNCYASGNTQGSSNYVGGFAGRDNAGVIEYSYSIGEVTSTGSKGGLIGDLVGGGTITKSYWNNTINSGLDGIGNTTSAEVIAASTEDMKLQGTYTDWNFTTTWTIDNDYNEKYPYLINADATFTGNMITIGETTVELKYEPESLDNPYFVLSTTYDMSGPLGVEESSTSGLQAVATISRAYLTPGTTYYVCYIDDSEQSGIYSFILSPSGTGVIEIGE
jgi:hypothetical protein